MSATINNATGASITTLGKLGDEINIPELLMSIQIERSSLLDGQIKGQMSDMQARNNWLKDSNSALSALRAARPATDTGTADMTAVSFTDHTGQTQTVGAWAAANGISTALGATPEQQNAANDASAASTALETAYQNGSWGAGASQNVPQPTFVNSQGVTVGAIDYLKAAGFQGGATDLTKNDDGTYTMAPGRLEGLSQGANDIAVRDQAIVDTANHPTGTQIDSAINTFKSTIDTVNSQSQMDMVRLQGLMDKRNQAFDMMTNTLSKTGKSIDDITGNMR